MSDETPQFYDALETVMGKPEHRLLSWWHTYMQELDYKFKYQNKELFENNVY